MNDRFLSKSGWFGIICGVAAIGCILPEESKAQVNELKIERDASGIYNGRAGGGKYAVTYDDPFYSPHGGDVPTINARARIPVKDGKLSSVANDSELPGNHRATAKGVEKKSDVIRGGKRIVIKAAGTMDLDEGPTHGIWRGGVISGFLDDKGVRWFGSASSSPASQRNQSDPLLPPDHTRRVIGVKYNGRG